jgi:hypothetical protein
LTTTITPWQILWGKLIAGLRVSSVLTSFLLWPVLLACLMVSAYWTNLLSVLGYLIIVALSCLTTAIVALFCSVILRKTAVSLMTTYLIIIVLFCVPLAARFFAEGFFPNHEATPRVIQAGLVSPFAAAFAVPLDVEIDTRSPTDLAVGNVPLLLGYGGFTCILVLFLVVAMIWLFNTRWRVSRQSGD